MDGLGILKALSTISRLSQAAQDNSSVKWGSVVQEENAEVSRFSIEFPSFSGLLQANEGK